MNKIIAIHADDFQVTVKPGLGYKDLNIQLGRHGLFFAPDPGANASIGGMLGNNAAGIRTVKYGATKDNVLRMQVVLADGRIVDTGSRSVKGLYNQMMDFQDYVAIMCKEAASIWHRALRRTPTYP